VRLIKPEEARRVTIYLKRNGKMVFWRIGRLGGSFYLASSTVADTTVRDIRRAKRQNNRRELSYYCRVVAWRFA
jgi:hypothetical protein